MAALWYPQAYCLRYGLKWCTDPYDGPPHYPKVPVIRITDISALHMRRRPRKAWRRARDAALAEWQVSGLVLPVTELSVPEDGYKAGRITLAAKATPDGTAGYAGFGMSPGAAVGWPDPTAELPWPGVGWAHVDDDWFEGQWRSGVLGPLRKVIGHEVGHAFGFGHNPGTGCMDVKTGTTAHVSAEEATALATYYLP